MSYLIVTLGRGTVAALIILFANLVALLGCWIVSPRVFVAHRREDPDLTGHVAGITGVINAVLFAFIVFATWTYHDHAEEAVGKETGTIWKLWADVEAMEARPGHEPVRVLGDSLRKVVASQLTDYVDYVANQEWNFATWDTASSDGGTRVLREAYETVLLHAKADTAPEKGLTGELVREFNALFEARQERIAYGTEPAISPMVWIVLLGGGVLCFGCCWLIGFKNLQLHALFMSLIATSFGLILVLIFALNTPFTGIAPIPPKRFCDLSTNISRWESIERTENSESPKSEELEHHREARSSAPKRRRQKS
jgi:hypothetical protein